MPFQLTALPAFNDNYLWLLDDGQRALVVDPGDAKPVLQALQSRNLKLDTILVTHHHGDHVGGVNELRASTGARVIGPATENIPKPYEPVGSEHTVNALGLTWRVLDVPGHTAGHVAYWGANVMGHPLLFCGDTLFSAGCGRLFEGTPAQMLASLDTLAALPTDTRVCAAHEYTISNLKFALAVEPQNENTIQHMALCQSLRAAGIPTLPSTLALELNINPFLRVRERSVAQAAQAHTPSSLFAANDAVAVLAALREWKNNFS